MAYGEDSEAARPSMSKTNGHSNRKGKGRNTTKMIILMRLVPSRIGNVPHQKMETARVFLHLLDELGFYGSGFVESVTHPFMTISSNDSEVVETQRFLGTIRAQNALAVTLQNALLSAVLSGRKNCRHATVV